MDVACKATLGLSSVSSGAAATCSHEISRRFSPNPNNLHQHPCFLPLTNGVSTCQRKQKSFLPRPAQPYSRRLPPAQASSSLGTTEAKVAKDDLLNAISSAERGLKTRTPESRAAIFRAVEALEKLVEGQSTTTANMLSATWKLRWTTEKEILFILEKAGIFGTQAGDVFQVIDVARGKLNNIITFPPSGAFVVDSTIQVESAQRVNFRFEKAKLKTASWQLGLPPFGQGWFDNVYVDETLRVARDSRGDVLVVEKASAAWK